jgi:hypothetical protein
MCGASKPWLDQVLCDLSLLGRESQGTYSQMVSTTLMSKSAPQPAMMATPRGGTDFACRR